MSVTDKEKKLEQELLKLVEQELESCVETGRYPVLCNIASTTNGFQRIYNMVENLCKETGMSVSAAMAQIESSYE